MKLRFVLAPFIVLAACFESNSDPMDAEARAAILSKLHRVHSISDINCKLVASEEYYCSFAILTQSGVSLSSYGSLKRYDADRRYSYKSK